MADVDPVAALAADVTKLRQQIRRAYAKLATVESAVAGLAKMLERALGDDQTLEPEAPYWLTGAAQVYAAQVDAGVQAAAMAALLQWMDGVLRPEYPGYCDWLRDCWAEHPEARWELSTLWAAWRLAYDRRSLSLEAAIAWHDRLLPGVRARLAPVFQGCAGAGGCQHRQR